MEVSKIYRGFFQNGTYAKPSQNATFLAFHEFPLYLLSIWNVANALYLVVSGGFRWKSDSSM